MEGSKHLSVCVIAPEMPPTIGGAETFSEVLVIALAQQNVQVYLITSKQPRKTVQEALAGKNGKIYLLESSFMKGGDGYVEWEYYAFSCAELVHKVLSENRIDIVHALSHDTILAASIALADPEKGKKPKLVITTSEMSTEDTAFGRSRSRFIYSLPIDGLVQLSKYYMDIACKYECCASEKIITAAIDLDLFQSGDKSRGISLLNKQNDKFIILCPSRFTERKGQVDLVKAVELLDDEKKKKIICVFAGSINSASSEYEKKLHNFIQQSTVQCIMTSIKREDMPDVLAATDLLVMPSYKEGLGFSAIEGMASGCPVLANKVSGLIEIPDHNKQMEFVELGNIQQLAQKISYLFENDDIRKNLGKNGKILAETKFSPGNMASNIISLYERLIAI